MTAVMRVVPVVLAGLALAGCAKYGERGGAV